MKNTLVVWLCTFLALILAPPAAADTSNPPPAESALVHLLKSKGILTDAEVASIMQTEPRSAAESRLARVLLSKGVISQSDYDALVPAVAAVPAASRAVERTTVIAAVAPIRALGLAGDAVFKRDGLLAPFRIGPDVKLKPYGLFKVSFISDSSSPCGNDFPMPGFMNDTGPGNSSELHLNARSLRIGTDVEWLDPSRSVTITGKVEADFEGNFSRANNRNISSIRSPGLQMRLAWMRVDRKISDRTSAFALFGQDWTPFGSSTLPPLLETTGLGLGYGILYERAPQFRFGVARTLGGARQWKVEPEFAVVLPAYGNPPSDIGNQLGFGERQGADSNRPEIQGRLVGQFQLDAAPGVAPAQLIGSWTYGRRSALVKAADVPAGYKVAFPTGARADSGRNGVSLEAQLPTRWFTLLLKGFSGKDLRFYLVGNLLSNFNDVAGLSSMASAASIDGSSTVVFGTNASGAAVVAPQRGVRARGGFADLGIPLSRLLKADAEGRHAGWTFNVLYSFDEAVPRDVRRLGAANRSRSEIFAGTLAYRFNKYFNVAFEESYYRTRAANRVDMLPLFRGIPSYQWHDVREQLSVFTTF